MLLSTNTVIAKEKLTKYLLVLLPKDDKSQFLQRAGYTLENWQQLEIDLREQILTQPAKFVETTIYGSKYRIDATLRGVNGVELEVTLTFHGIFERYNRRAFRGKVTDEVTV